MPKLTDKENEAVRELIEMQDDLKKLRGLVPLADEVKKAATYRNAKRILWNEWRGIIIGLAAVVTAIVFLLDTAKSILQGWLGGP